MQLVIVFAWPNGIKLLCIYKMGIHIVAIIPVHIKFLYKNLKIILRLYIIQTLKKLVEKKCLTVNVLQNVNTVGILKILKLIKLLSATDIGKAMTIGQCQDTMMLLQKDGIIIFNQDI